MTCGDGLSLGGGGGCPIQPLNTGESSRYTAEFVHRVIFVHKFPGVWTKQVGGAHKLPGEPTGQESCAYIFPMYGLDKGFVCTNYPVYGRPLCTQDPWPNDRQAVLCTQNAMSANHQEGDWGTQTSTLGESVELGIKPGNPTTKVGERQAKAQVLTARKVEPQQAVLWMQIGRDAQVAACLDSTSRTVEVWGPARQILAMARYVGETTQLIWSTVQFCGWCITIHRCNVLYCP